MDISALVRFSTGHNFLLRHNNLIDPLKYPSKLCSNCGEEEETGDHIINRCPKFYMKRLTLTGKGDTSPMDWSIKDLTKFLTDPAVLKMEHNDNDDEEEPN